MAKGRLAQGVNGKHTYCGRPSAGGKLDTNLLSRRNDGDTFSGSQHAQKRGRVEGEPSSLSYKETSQQNWREGNKEEQRPRGGNFHQNHSLSRHFEDHGRKKSKKKVGGVK